MLLESNTKYSTQLLGRNRGRREALWLSEQEGQEQTAKSSGFTKILVHRHLEKYFRMFTATSLAITETQKQIRGL